MRVKNALTSALIEERVDKCPFTGCWNWQKYTSTKGYGMVRVGGELWHAHRASYSIFKGPIPPGKVVLHSCDNPACANPYHLRVGTQKDNILDMHRKGRQANRQGSSNGKSKLTEGAVVRIREDARLLKEIAHDYGVSISCIDRVKNFKTWRHI